MYVNAQFMHHKAIAAELMDGLRKRLAELLPPNTSMRADIEQQIEKLLKSHQTPEHPPYALMIRQAIETLNKEGGSDEAAISERIKLEYESLPWGHKSLLNHHLKKLTREGELVRVSADRYMLPPEESVSIGMVEQKQEHKGKNLQKEESANQHKLPRNGVSRIRSPRKKNFKIRQSLKRKVAETEVGSEAVGVSEEVEERDQLQEGQIQVNERPKPVLANSPGQEKLSGIRVSEEMHQVCEEQEPERIEVAVNEPVQLQGQHILESELLKPEGTNRPRQEKISDIEASEETCQVCEERAHEEMEDADQALKANSPAVEGDRTDGRRDEAAVGDVKQGDHQPSELVEGSEAEEEQNGEVNIPKQVQEESDHLLVKDDRVDMQEICWLPDKRNQEDEDPENVTVEKEIEKEPQDALVEGQRVEMNQEQNQQGKLQTTVTGPVLLLQEMETALERIEKLIESQGEQDAAVTDAVKQQEKQAEAGNKIADNRQQEHKNVPESTLIPSSPCQRSREVGSSISPEDKCLELLKRINGIFDILKPVLAQHRSANASIETLLGGDKKGTRSLVETEVPADRQQKSEVCAPSEEVITQSMENSDFFEAMDVMLIEAELHFYRSHNSKRPPECAVTTLENLSQRQEKQPKLSEQRDVENFSGTSCVLEYRQQLLDERGYEIPKASEANSAEGRTPLLSSVGGKSSVTRPLVASPTAENDKEAEACNVDWEQQLNPPGGAVKVLVISSERENEEATVLGNEPTRPDLSTELQLGSSVPPPQAKQKEGFILVKEGNQPDLKIVEQHQKSPTPQDMNPDRLKQQRRLLTCSQHKQFESKANAIHRLTEDSSTLLASQPAENDKETEVCNVKGEQQLNPPGGAVKALVFSCEWENEEATVLGNEPIRAYLSSSMPPPQEKQKEGFLLVREGSQPDLEIREQHQEISALQDMNPERLKQHEQQLYESSLFKPPVLGREKLEPLKPAELQKLLVQPKDSLTPLHTPTKSSIGGQESRYYKTKLRPRVISSPPEAVTGLSECKQRGEKKPARVGRPRRMKNEAGEKSPPLTQKQLGKPTNAGEEPPFNQKRRGRPPKRKQDADAARAGAGAGAGSASPLRQKCQGRPPKQKPALAIAMEEPKPLL
ncbi:nestin-like isoform X2 [Punica granatum]|uniref:Nestin-like isoform X2 n=2 Tax=Punica granatum TaxID=22663 RepID=A0A6P8DRG6_PUNGR|nr:nestin-like isoform X2 [Punica granatum]